MNFKYLVLVSCILIITQSLNLLSTVQPTKKQCYYQTLEANQKYTIDIIPKNNNQSYKFQVFRHNTTTQEWELLYERQSPTTSPLNAHKLTPSYGTYSFCLENPSFVNLDYQIKIASGLELMELNLLPDQSDAQKLKAQIIWIQNQKDNILETLQRNHGIRTASEQMTNSIGINMFIFMIVCVGIVVFLNGMLYLRIQKGLKQRKLI